MDIVKPRILDNDTLGALALQVWPAPKGNCKSDADCYTVPFVRFKFDKRKSLALRKNPRRGIGFEEAQEVFSRSYFEDQRKDQPKQYRAIGWVKGRLYAVIYEVRKDTQGEYYHLVTLWKATEEEEKLYEENL